MQAATSQPQIQRRAAPLRHDRAAPHVHAIPVAGRGRPVSGNMGSRVLAHQPRAASSRLSGLAGAYTRA